MISGIFCDYYCGIFGYCIKQYVFKRYFLRVDSYFMVYIPKGLLISDMCWMWSVLRLNNLAPSNLCVTSCICWFVSWIGCSVQIDWCWFYKCAFFNKWFTFKLLGMYVRSGHSISIECWCGENELYYWWTVLFFVMSADVHVNRKEWFFIDWFVIKVFPFLLFQWKNKRTVEYTTGSYNRLSSKYVPVVFIHHFVYLPLSVFLYNVINGFVKKSGGRDPPKYQSFI